MNLSKPQKRIAIICCLVFLFMIYVVANEFDSFDPPAVPRQDMTEVLKKDFFTEEDYSFLLEQTGLGKPAIDELKATSEHFEEEMASFQEQYFCPVQFRSIYVFPTTKEERLVNSDGSKRLLKFAPVKNGDIVVTKGTHTLSWRHGHAAIVTNAEANETIEHVLLGQLSSFQTVDKWRGYPSVLILRLKNSDEVLQNEIAVYAKEHLAGIPYSPFVGLKRKDKSGMDRIDSTQCAHLVWQVYQAFGVNTDSNHGWLVMPRDIANSEELELVQVFGFDPHDRWN